MSSAVIVDSIVVLVFDISDEDLDVVVDVVVVVAVGTTLSSLSKMPRLTSMLSLTPSSLPLMILGGDH